MTIWDKQQAATANIRKGPYAWIQWKGTDVCMDLHCRCGYHSHIDSDFTYFVRCPYCRQIYAANGHIVLTAIAPAELEAEGLSEDLVHEADR